MKFLNKPIKSTFFINILIVVTLFLPFKFILNSLGYNDYYFIINSLKPCLVKWLLYFSLASSYPNKSLLFKLYLSSLLASVLLGTFSSNIISFYISMSNISKSDIFIQCMAPGIRHEKMTIPYILSPTPYNHNEWMALTKTIREAVQLKINEDKDNGIENRSYYLRNISKFLTREQKKMLRALPGFSSRDAVFDLHINRRSGIREDNLTRINDNY